MYAIGAANTKKRSFFSHSEYSREYMNDIKLVIPAGNLFSALSGKSVLVTGATGLIGSATIDLLICLNEVLHSNIRIYPAARNPLRLEKRFGGYLKKSYCRTVSYDAAVPLNYDLFGEPLDYIIHAAGNSHPSAIAKEPVETITSCVTGLYNLLHYAKKNAVKRLVYISSSEIYGNRAACEDRPYREDDYGSIDILNPRSCYPVGKRASETLLISYLEEYGVNSCIVRPGHVYGPTQSEEDSRASAQFLRSARAGTSIVMKSPGIQKRSYCHCFDCAAAILTVLLRGNTGEAYNISNASSIATVREFAETCARAAGVNIRFEAPSEKEAKSYNMMENSVLSADKLEKLGWKGYYDLEPGIRETLKILTS